MAENYYYSSLSGDEIESRLVGGVVFNADQALTTSEKARARQNIGAGESDSTFKVLGYYDTYEDMIQGLQLPPQPGDAYGIGTASPFDIYVYDGVHDEWVNNGPIVLSDAVIDDEDIALDTTWSSSKINTEVGAVRTLANAAQTAAGAAQTTADGKAPKNHASTATTYGVGNASNYGHLKLSNSPNASQGTGSGVAATPSAVQAAIDKASWTLLWTNPNPTASFSPQTISVDLSNYNAFAVSVIDDGLYVGTFTFVKNDFSGNGAYSFARPWSGGGGIFSRIVSFSDSGIYFDAGRQTTLPNTYNGSANGRAIPIKIYGIKS